MNAEAHPRWWDEIYEDADAPTPHRVEAGLPEARFMVLDRDEAQPSGWRATPQRLAYDIERAAALALANNRADVARALRTGRV